MALEIFQLILQMIGAFTFGQWLGLFLFKARLKFQVWLYWYKYFKLRSDFNKEVEDQWRFGP